MLKLYLGIKNRLDAVKDRLKRFHKDEEGPTMVEYGLLLALIAIVAIVAVALVGTNVSSTFNRAGNSMSN